MEKNNLISDWDASKGNLSSAIVVAGAKGHGGIASYNADGDSIEKKRGIVLGKRIKLTDEFIEDHTKDKTTFKTYLEGKGLTTDQFNANLPNVLKNEVVGDGTALDADFIEYHNALSAYYHMLHVSDLVNKNVPKKSSGLSADPSLNDLTDIVRNDISRGMVPGGAWVGADSWQNGFGKWFQKNVTDKVIPPGSAVNKAGDKAIASVKKAAQNTYDAGTQGLKAPVRGAFLSILDLNLVGIATSFKHVKDDKDQTHWNKILASWKNGFQGDDTKLANAVEIGAKKKELFKNLFHHKNADGSFSVDAGSDVGKSVNETAGALAAITPILAAAPDPTVSKAAAGWTGIAGAALKVIQPILKGFAQSKGVPTTQLAPDFVPPPPGSTAPVGDNSGAGDFQTLLSDNKWWIVGGVAMITLIGVFLMTGTETKK